MQELRGRTIMKKINVLDLFCGAGGLSCGFERAGFNIVLGIDNDKKALETFEANHNGAKSICGDITEIGYEDIKNIIGDKTIDVIIGGPPCPDFSIGGKNRGREGDNGKLSLSYIQLIKTHNPDFFLFENVKGLWRTAKHREFYEELKKELEQAELKKVI